MNTMIELVPELEKLSNIPERQLLIDDAKNGEYHDYRNKNFACGKIALISLMQKWGEMYPFDREQALKIRGDVIDGQYDEEFTDEDKEFLCKELSEDCDTSEANKAFFKMAMGLK